MPAPLRVVALVSGSGTLLQAVLDAAADPGYGVQVVAVGADREGIAGLERAETRGVPTFVVPVGAHPDRAAWDRALASAIGAHRPDVVLSAGFMKILGPTVLAEHAVINTHPALLPSFPGAHGVRDALAHGVKVTGCTLHQVDADVDTGPILAQRAVDVLEGDDEESLHERIKVAEREMLVEQLPGVLRRLRRGLSPTTDDGRAPAPSPPASS
ncbi:phosphoribosylglycinamide formyltransferase [Ornithinimicrobium panacihumi]|uniref:phosphoribosylglycinamide formyltransferase n=1 Tax=Ornithinimicrobium panacihumi TaxID=2008449 RepID=UPI003F8CBF73